MDDNANSKSMSRLKLKKMFQARHPLRTNLNYFEFQDKNQIQQSSTSRALIQGEPISPYSKKNMRLSGVASNMTTNYTKYPSLRTTLTETLFPTKVEKSINIANEDSSKKKVVLDESSRVAINEFFSRSKSNVGCSLISSQAGEAWKKQLNSSVSSCASLFRRYSLGKPKAYRLGPSINKQFPLDTKQIDKVDGFMGLFRKRQVANLELQGLQKNLIQGNKYLGRDKSIAQIKELYENGLLKMQDDQKTWEDFELFIKEDDKEKKKSRKLIMLFLTEFHFPQNFIKNQNTLSLHLKLIKDKNNKLLNTAKSEHIDIRRNLLSFISQNNSLFEFGRFSLNFGYVSEQLSCKEKILSQISLYNSPGTFLNAKQQKTRFMKNDYSIGYRYSRNCRLKDSDSFAEDPRIELKRKKLNYILHGGVIKKNEVPDNCIHKVVVKANQQLTKLIRNNQNNLTLLKFDHFYSIDWMRASTAILGNDQNINILIANRGDLIDRILDEALKYFFREGKWSWKCVGNHN